MFAECSKDPFVVTIAYLIDCLCFNWNRHRNFHGKQNGILKGFLLFKASLPPVHSISPFSYKILIPFTCSMFLLCSDRSHYYQLIWCIWRERERQCVVVLVCRHTLDCLKTGPGMENGDCSDRKSGKARKREKTEKKCKWKRKWDRCVHAIGETAPRAAFWHRKKVKWKMKFLLPSHWFRCCCCCCCGHRVVRLQRSFCLPATWLNAFKLESKAEKDRIKTQMR